jgi:hypothetical protein
VSINAPVPNSAAQTTSTTHPTTITGVTAGDTLILAIATRSSQTAPTGIADDTNGSWTIDATRGIWHGAAPSGNNIGCGLYFFPNSAAGTGTIIITPTFAGSETRVVQGAMVTSTAQLELEDTASGSNAAATSHPLSTNLDVAAAGLALLNAIETATLTETVTTGFTAWGDGGFRQYAQYQNIAAGYSSTSAWTSSTSGDSVVVGLSLREVSAGGASIVPLIHHHYMQAKRKCS